MSAKGSMTSTALADQAQHSRAHLEGLLGRSRQHDLLYMGVKMRWRVWGHGPRVLLVHGEHGSWTHWVKNIGELAAHFEVMVPDLPGFGDSDSIPNAANPDDTVARMVDCLVHGLSQLPGNSPLAHVAAFSFGTLLAARLAYRLPTLQTLTLLGPAAHDLGAVLPQAPCAVRLVWGEADLTTTPYEAAHRLSALHHDCQWTIISNAGHWVQYEQHELINALLLSWWLAAPKEST